MSKISLQNVCVDGKSQFAKFINLRSLILGKMPNLKVERVPILKNINLEIKSGDKIGFIGKNGAGKTSLMRTILGAYPPVSGTVNVTGKCLPILDLGAGLNGELSGRYNIKLLFLYNGNLSQYNKEIEDEIIEFSGISREKIDVPLKLYSMGMVARLIFSATVFQKGDILIMDEAFATGDKDFIKKSYNYMLKKWKEVDIGLTISHDLEEIEQLCDHCYIVDNGEIVDSGTPSEMIKLYNKF
ncbi:ABC transporter ATP-binding protein [Candidatus Deianiraea vastatrix]|uniref:ABC transporter ATP-binding protein n=1 Tax=Candidatus Deianiraea vastatrix TaxID=2163644 RepID=A0A5B8XF06_9RICK|nr:ATP-binding cassette domain-containing protein [Candidatus Deianiraea vastatrix]QED23872.1 Putative ABC transporter ATP-binding protein [Candidatus Deianiraea vastatrix]